MKKVLKVVLRLCSVLGSLTIVLACFMGAIELLVPVHPNIITAEAAKKEQQCNISKRYQTYAANERALVLNEYLSGENLIPKIYRIPDGTVKAPQPNPACFGSIEYKDADQIKELVKKAEAYGLMEGQEIVFNPDATLFHRGNIKYYLDPTIFVITWKEFINNRIVNLMEVKIADASQIRRKLTEDTYGSEIQQFATELATQANAVAACGGDFYSFRALGIVCYEGKIYRYGETVYGTVTMGNCLDTLFIDKNGDFQFFKKKTEMTKDELQKFVDDNDLSFSLSFGPILILDGVPQRHSSYSLGQITQTFSRAGIGQVDHLHYLYMMESNWGEAYPGVTLDEFTDIMMKKGVRHAYNLDGGQTGEYIINNKLESLVDFGQERAVSDIVYFATAIPKEDWE